MINVLNVLVDIHERRTREYIEKFGYTWGINEPFLGCLIPGDYYIKDNRVKGFMFEINKRLLPEIYKVYQLISSIINDNGQKN